MNIYPEREWMCTDAAQWTEVHVGSPPQKKSLSKLAADHWMSFLSLMSSVRPAAFK